MPFVTASDGTELYYEVEGEGFPLVFTHGNMGFGQQFFLQTRIFRKQYHCILHDLRGCGLSGKPQAEVYDTKIHSSDLHTILQALGVKKAVHLGHSFGGPISLQYYFDYPDEVAGLVFFGSYSAGTQLAITDKRHGAGLSLRAKRSNLRGGMSGWRDCFVAPLLAMTPQTLN
jgi:3-oxoadipate enol-lactonase